MGSTASQLAVLVLSGTSGVFHPVSRPIDSERRGGGGRGEEGDGFFWGQLTILSVADGLGLPAAAELEDR